jgi:hypothetical protein
MAEAQGVVCRHYSVHPEGENLYIIDVMQRKALR